MTFNTFVPLELDPMASRPECPQAPAKLPRPPSEDQALRQVWGNVRSAPGQPCGVWSGHHKGALDQPLSRPWGQPTPCAVLCPPPAPSLWGPARSLGGTDFKYNEQESCFLIPPTSERSLGQFWMLSTSRPWTSCF